MNRKPDPMIKAQAAIIDQQNRTIDRLTKEVAEANAHIANLYKQIAGTTQTYVNIAEIIKNLNESNNLKASDTKALQDLKK